MPALLVLNYDVQDETALAGYRTEAAPVVLAGSGHLLTSTKDTLHLGEAREPGGTHTVVLSFETFEEAVARYQSAEYQRLLQRRLAATIPKAAFIVETTAPVTVLTE